MSKILCERFSHAPHLRRENIAVTLRGLVITSLSEDDPPCLGWGGGGGIKDTTYLMNITDKILLALKCEEIFS